MYGKSNMETYITIYKIDSRWEFAVWLKKLIQGLCINLGGRWGGRWERGSGGREHWCIYGWFLLMYDRKPQSSVKQLSFNLKIKFKKTELVNTPAPFFFGVEVSPSPVLIFFLVSFLVCLFIIWSSVQFSSVAQSCLALCDPRNHSTSGLPVHHQLPESTQTHVHRVGNAIQPSHPLSFPSPAALNFSQHHGLFK